MSPRPTNSRGKTSRSPRAARSVSAYLPVAMLPSRTTSSRSPSARVKASTSRRSGPRYRSSPPAMSTSAKAHRSRAVTCVSGETRPRSVVITSTPARPNARAYASLPRKYKPLRKLNTSPIATPSGSRSARASGNSACALRINFARSPSQRAGERRNMRAAMSLSRCKTRACRVCPQRLATEVPYSFAAFSRRTIRARASARGRPISPSRIIPVRANASARRAVDAPNHATSSQP